MGRKSWGILAAAAAAGLTAGAVVERTMVRRMRDRPDPESAEPLGSIRGTDIGPLVSFDGTQLHLERAGEGPTLVFSHGYSLETRLWHYQIRDLASRYRLYLYDQRGHGLSGQAKDGDWSLEALAHDLLAVVKATGTGGTGGNGRVVVVAHSMGGMAALKAFELFPEQMNARLAGLVLCDTTSADVMPGVLQHLPRRIVSAVQSAEEVILRALLSFDRPTVDKLRRRASDFGWLTVRIMGFGPNASPAHVAFMEKMLADTSIDTWIELIAAVSAVDVTAALPKIHVPTLVLVGTHDRMTPMAAAQRLVQGIEGARLGTIAGAGHTPMLETPRSFNARLKVFLDKLDWQAPAAEAAAREAADRATAAGGVEGPAAAS